MASLLSEGRTREAVATAKDAAKEWPGRDTEGALLSAYQARARSLLREGLDREAAAILGVAAERLPWAKDQLAPIEEEIRLVGGGFRLLLTALAAATDGERRRLLDILTRNLTDPGVLAGSPHLAADDPLRLEAAAVRDVFTAVTSGPLPEGGLARLDGIGRASPLAPWKLLCRAIDAFYRGDAASVSRNAAAIPESSAVHALVPLLLNLAGGQPRDPERAEGQGPADVADALSPQSRALLERLSGPGARLGALLGQLQEALKGRDEARVRRLVSQLRDPIDALPRPRRLAVLRSIVQIGVRDCELGPEPFHGLGTGRNRHDIVRMVALAVEDECFLPATAAWQTFLDHALSAGLFNERSRETAFILNRMAGLFPPDERETLEHMGVPSLSELRRDIRSGLAPACFDQEALLRRSIAVFPTREAFRGLIRLLRGRPLPDARTAEGKVWREFAEAFPDDEEVLAGLIERAEAREDDRELRELYEKARAAGSLSPAIRLGPARLELRLAQRAIRGRKWEVAREAFERLEADPEASGPDVIAARLALRSAWARKLPKSRAARKDGTFSAAGRDDGAGPPEPFEEELARRTSPLLSSLLCAAACRLTLAPEPVERPRATLTSRLEALRRLAEILPAVVFDPALVPAWVVLDPADEARDLSSEELLRILGEALSPGNVELVHRVTSSRLRLDEPRLADFLLLRARSFLVHGPRAPELRLLICLDAARTLAKTLDRSERERIEREAETLVADRPWLLGHSAGARVTPRHAQSIVEVEARMESSRIDIDELAGRRRRHQHRSTFRGFGGRG